MWIPYKLESPTGYDPIYPKRTAEFITVVNGGKVENPAGRYGGIKRFDSPLIDLSNIKYILTLKNDDSGSFGKREEQSLKFQPQKFKLVFEDKSVQVLENTTVLPRAFIVYDYEVEADKDKIFDILLESGFDLSNKIILEETIPQSLKKGEVRQIIYTEKIDGGSEILVNHSGDGLLFVSDSYYPGWKAFVDGEETKIYRADYNFRAIVVSAGEHKITFKYEPQSFKIGVYLSGGTLLLILTGLTIFWKRKKF